MVIGLNGRLKSGKDTTFGIIQDLYPYAERVSFADKLKRSAAASLGISVEMLEKLKNLEDVYVGLDYDDEGMPKMFMQNGPSFNIRQFLQRYGTEAHREIFGDNFWVDQALPIDTEHMHRLLVVTDMRFPNEVQRVKDLGGICVKVERSIDTETKHGDHPSEQDVDYMIDYFLDNNGDLAELRNNVRKLFYLVPDIMRNRAANLQEHIREERISVNSGRRR